MRQHTGRSGADALLAEIQRDVMQADRKETQGRQQRQIAKARQADAADQRDDAHECRSHQKPQQRQMAGIISLQTDMNPGRGIPPAGDDKRHRQHDLEGGGGDGGERLHGRIPVGLCTEYRNSNRSPQLTYTALTVHFG
ncbi:hypothetical protein D3C86_1800670 [compost metagenome]